LAMEAMDGRGTNRYQATLLYIIRLMVH